MKQEDKFILRGSLQTSINGLEILSDRILNIAKANNSDPAKLEIQYQLNEARTHILAAVNKIKHVNDELLK